MGQHHLATATARPGELSAQIADPLGLLVKAGSMGRPGPPGHRVVLLDADDKPAKEGEAWLVLGSRTASLA